MKHLRPFLAITALLLFPTIAHTQTYQPTNRTPVADTTLGTQVSENGSNFNITGGVGKGHTLFHSFTDFSVPTNGQANFLNPVGNRDIITRVTGNVFSDINGLVNTNGANFFLINPNGIVFGTNARLNVGKAFVGSTANSLDLVDGGGRTITFGTNVNGDAPLLSVAPNVLFDVSRLNLGGGSGQISNFGTLQTPNNSQYIGLIGGNVTLDGSAGGGKIVAPGGRVDIGGLSGAGSVSVDNNGLVFSSTGVGRSNIVLTDGAGITVRATGTLDTVQTFFNNASSNGSSLNISANNLDLLNAGAISDTLPAAIDAGLETDSGVQTKAAGNINIDATGKVNLNNSAIKNTLRSGAEGSTGDINIQAGTLDVNNNSAISTIIAGKGNAGNIVVRAKDAVSLTDSSIIASQVFTGGVGNSGSVNINAGSLSLKDGSQLTASTFGVGNAGNIIVTAKDSVSLVNGNIFSTVAAGGVGKGGTIDVNAASLSMTNGAQLLTSTLGASDTQPAGIGDAGGITVKVTGAVDIAGININASAIFSDVETGTTGNSGNISITAGSLSMRDGATLQASTAGIGNAGNVTVTAKNTVSLVNSGILSTVEAGGVGKGGTIAIDAGSLSLTSNGRLSTATRAGSTTQPAGQGDAGDITVKVSGAVDIAGNNGTSASGIFSSVATGTKGNGGNISIAAGSLSLQDVAILKASASGVGNAGDIDIKTTGDIKIYGYSSSSIDRTDSDRSFITSDTSGQGDTGKITIDTQGKLYLVNGGNISSSISSDAVGNSKGINIRARELELSNNSSISTASLANTQGNAGDIDIKTTGDIKISGYSSSSIDRTDSGISFISSSASGQGDTGKITIDTQGKLSLVNGANLSSAISSDAVGNSKGINITARELELSNNSFIAAASLPNTQGNAGDINIKTTGDIKIGYSSSSIDRTDSGISSISSSTSGQGDTGKITIDTQGKLSLVNGGSISSTIASDAVGNSKGINITARELELSNNSFIAAASLPNTQGNAGDINIKTTGDIKISGYSSSSIDRTDSGIAFINSDTLGQGDTGKITIDTQGKLSLVNGGSISSTIASNAVGNSKGISIAAQEIELNKSFIKTSTNQTAQVNGKGNAGDIDLRVKGEISLNNLSAIATNSFGVGAAGNVSIGASRLLFNRGGILSQADSTSGGNVTLTISDLLLIQNGGFLTTNSGSTQKNGNGGNITISSPLIVALPGNNDISANANGGTGGQVNITSQGLFGIQYRAQGSPLTSDITASSTFGQSGTVNIDTPGTDPGRDSTELPNVTTDASNQISQVCNTTNRQNKLTVTGRGGLPPNANDPLTSDVVWQDARAVNSQPAISSTTTSPPKFAPPAVGWVFDGKGKVMLIAAGTQGQPTGTSVVCQNVVRQEDRKGEGVKGKGF